VRVLGLTLTALVLLPSRSPAVVSWIGAAFAATSFAWVGHARVAGYEGLAVSVLGMHLIGVSFWLGALGPLLLIARDPDPAGIGAAAARFGRVALLGVGVLIAAGTVVLACVLGSVSEFWSSDYGRAFVAKLGLVVCLLGLAALNKLRLTPRVNTGIAGAACSLARSIRVEIIVGGLILLTTAALTTLWGPATLE
jgi:putative copper resistance protein D